MSVFQMAITCDCPMSQPGPTLASTCGGGAFMLFMGLLEVFLRSQCDLEDPCGRAQVSNPRSKHQTIYLRSGSILFNTSLFLYNPTVHNDHLLWTITSLREYYYVLDFGKRIPALS